jgi:hypothetical protein
VSKWVWMGNQNKSGLLDGWKLQVHCRVEDGAVKAKDLHQSITGGEAAVQVAAVVIAKLQPAV